MHIFPKIIHQIHFGNDSKYLTKFDKNIKDLRKHNHNYSYYLWTEEDAMELMLTRQPQFYNIYKKLNLLEKTDFFRYVLLYEFGGIYCDLDVQFHQSIDKFFEQTHIYHRLVRGVVKLPKQSTAELFNPFKYDIILSGENYLKNGESYVNNFFMISRARDIFWLNVLTEISSRLELDTLYKTGCFMLTNMLQKYAPNALILPPFYFGWGSYMQEKIPAWVLSSHNTTRNRVLTNGWTYVPTTEPSVSPRSSKLVITVGTGTSKECLKTTMPRMKEYASRIGADFIALTDQTQEHGLLEKFRINQYAKYYERILFVDADVLIKRTSSDIFRCVRKGKIGMHDDVSLIEKTCYEQLLITEWNEMIESQKFKHYKTLHVFNSGVVVFDHDRRNIWTPPKHPLPKNHCAEQHYVQYLSGDNVQILPEKWNYQWWAHKNMPNISKSNFIHLAGMRNESPNTFIATVQMLDKLIP